MKVRSKEQTNNVSIKSYKALWHHTLLLHHTVTYIYITALNLQWSAIFPTEQVTQQQSTLFVKKLLAVAVSNIAYLRAIFPEHAFGDRCLEGKSTFLTHVT